MGLSAYTVVLWQCGKAGDSAWASAADPIPKGLPFAAGLAGVSPSAGACGAGGRSIGHCVLNQFKRGVSEDPTCRLLGGGEVVEFLCLANRLRVLVANMHKPDGKFVPVLVLVAQGRQGQLGRAVAGISPLKAIRSLVPVIVAGVVGSGVDRDGKGCRNIG